MYTNGSRETASQRDQTFGLLSNKRRRLVMRVLCDESIPCHLETLARKVAARERGVRPGDVTGAERQPVAIALHHTHLPKLDEQDVITYDAEDNEVVASAVVARLQDTADVMSALADVED